MWNTDPSCSPPPKKYRPESDCVIEELDLINKELDSLDDNDVFLRAQVQPDLKNPTCSNGFGNSVFSVVPPLAALFPNQRTSERHCLYLAPPDSVCPTSVQQSKAETPAEPPIQSHMIRPEIAQDARLEATVLQQVTELRHRGMWSAARLPKVMEPKPEKTLFGCLLKEVSWMSVDFKEERKWKIQMAHNLAVAARNYLLVRQEWNRQCQLVEELVRQRNAAYVAAMIRDWWKQIRKSLKYLEDKVHRQHLRYIRNQNKFLLANFSDLGPSWMVEHNATSPYVDCDPGETHIGSDGFTDDSEWLPDSLSVESDSSDSHSRSTSSSRAASFVDDSDASVFGITELRSGNGDTAPRVSEPCFSYQSIREIESNIQHINTAGHTVHQENFETDGVGRKQTVNDSEKVKPESDLSGTSTPYCVDRAELEALVLDSATPLEGILQSRRRLDKRTICLLPETWQRGSVSRGVDETKNVTSFHTAASNAGCCVVAWLRHAFARGVPGLLISPSAISGDAELTVAAHLGHLIVPGARCVEPSDVFPASKPLLQGETGDWGPHLIVAPRLCIPAWRARLSNWCPGLRITCLGLGCRGAKFPPCEPAGTGRRLRSAVIRGTVNVCITSYAAIFARPSRYSRIRWSVIVLDQIHHILPCSDVSQTLSKGATTEDSITKNIHLDHPGGQPIRRVVAKSASITASNGIDTLISELKYSGHRLLITSVPDLLSSACGYRLFELSRLLLSRDAANTDECKSWTTELFDTILDSGRSNPNQHVNNGRPSKKKLIKFLEPFVLRLDEDYEWEASISEEIVPCHMTAVQRQLHDAAMSTKTARNASKTGDLLDLLGTISLTSRICNHPCLSETRPQNSAAFADVMNDLTSRIAPKPGPFAFTVAHNEAPFCASGLLYSTPEAVLSAVRRLRDSELSEITLQGFNLLDSLREPLHIRERVALLAPTKKQLECVIIPTSIKKSHPKPPPVFNYDTPNGGMDYDSVYPLECLNGEDIRFPHNMKANCRLANGLPESTVHLDFSTITVRAKRPRVMSELPNAVSQPPTKRHRPECLGPQTVYRFLDLRFWQPLKKCFGRNKAPYLARGKRIPLLVNFAARFGADPPPDDGFVNSEPSTLSQSISFNPSIRVESLVSDNDRRCKQLVGFSDWCSEAIVNSFNFRCPSKMSPLHCAAKPFGWFAVQRSELHLPIWNLPSVFLSQLPYSSLLCSRSRVVASSPRLTSLRHPGLFHTRACDTLHNEAIEVSCATRPSSSFTSQDLLHLSSALSSALSSVYPFTEQARWLSPTVPYLSCNQRCNIITAFTGSALTPLGRIFLASGKFQGLHRLLEGLFGSHSSHYLDVSPWSSYSRLRLPSDYNVLGAESGQLIDRINDWPRGSHGPLLVLVHSRSPTACLTGLRAGPNTVVIVCDADWRSDSIDTLRALLHSWSLNGLVDHPQLDNADLSRTTLPVYRLVSFDDCVQSGLCPSVEACIARGVACRLLPGAVFQAHSITSSDRQSLAVARVQPNVVNEFLSCQLPAENRPASFRVDPLWTLKREAPSCSSASSVTSSFSYPAGGENRREKNGDLADECFNTFQEREPLCEQLLNRAFELFEDPVDTQAWCCAVAEQTAMALTVFNDFCVDECESSFSEDDSDHFHVQPADVFLNGELSGYNSTPGHSGLQQQLGYSETACWEVAHQEACRYLDSLNAWSAASPAMFYSDVNIDRRSSLTDLSSHDTLLNNWTPDNPLSFLCDIPIWNPMLDEHSQNEISPIPRAKAVFSLGDDDGADLNLTSIQLAPTEPRSGDTLSGDADCSDWGYESEPMSEHELPPVTHLSVVSTSLASSVTASSVPNEQSLRQDDTAHSTTDNEPSRHSRVVIGSNNAGARSSVTGPYLKRRRLASSALHTPRKSMSATLDTRMPVMENDNHSSPVTVAGESDVSMTPSPSTPHKSIGRDPSMLSGISVTQSGPLNSPSTMAQPGSGTSASSAGPGSTFLLSLHPHGSSTSNGPRLHIPRASYNREMINVRSNRMRRLNAVQSTVAATATGVNAAVVGAHFPAQQMTKTSPYHGQSGNLTSGNASPFSNPTSLTRYSHTSPGRQLHSVQSNQSTSFRYNGGTNVVVPCPLGGANNLVGLMANTSGNVVPGGHLHIGKPPEWLPQEEAALYQSICKLQDTSFDAAVAGNSNCVLSPNFHLAEFFINNFFPTRCYRGASQCLLMHAKMSAVVSTATAAMTSNACNLLQTTGIIPMDDVSVVTPLSTSATSHGPTSRKVKNNQECCSLPILDSVLQLVASTSRNDGLAVSEINADASSAVSKYRTYLAYQTLQSANNPEGGVANVDSGISSSGTDSSKRRESITNLKKTIKDSLFTSPAVHSTPFHRPPGSRRQVLTGFGGSQGTGSPASLYHASATGSSTSLYNYSSHSTLSASGPFLTTQPGQHSTSTAPPLNITDFVMTSIWEHNINPDTLITPAMVIKNKEEREARMLAEAVSSVSQACPASSVVCSSVTAVTSSTYQCSGAGQHHTQLSIHAQDGMHHPSVLLSLPLDCTASASGIVATASLPLNLTGSNLSFTHAGQRGTSFVTLQSANNPEGGVANVDSGISSSGTDSVLPPHLSQLFTTIRANDESQSRILKKTIKDSLFTSPAVHSTPFHRPPGSRRQVLTGFGGSQGTGSPASLYHASATGSSTSLYNYSSHSTLSASGPFLTTQPGHTTHTSTAPALLNHHRLRHDHLSGSQIGVSSSSPSVEMTGSGQIGLTASSLSSSSHSGPIIQKNPTHIAALQFGTAGHSFTIPCSGAGQHHTQLSIHAQDGMHHPSVLLSLPLDCTASASGIVATASLPLNLTGSNLSFTHAGQRGTSFVTIVSSNPTMLRRSATFTSVNLNNQFLDSSLSARLSSLQPNQTQTAVIGLSGSAINTQVSKGPMPAGYFLQQRPQFLATNQPISTRGIFTTLANISSSASLPVAGGFGSSATPLPQILRPRSTLRGSVIQSNFVRNIAPTNVSNFPINPVGTRLSPGTGSFLHSRLTLTVPPNSSTLSNTVGSRSGISTGLRTQSSSIYQQVRPVGQIAGNAQNSYVTYSGQLAVGELRPFNPLQGSQTSQFTPTVAVSSPLNTMAGSSRFESASNRQSESDPFVQSRFRPQPAP
ncbi:hypothetical protein AHF37_02286 [Paragonimus kellicotti]|nr:hypothetical protein AHF37_02286 [Paragonimus kellicotti]